MQLLPHLKDPLETLVCVTVRNLDLTKMSLRLLVRRKATRGTDVNTLVHRGEEDRILKCFCTIEDTDLSEGLYVMTRGTRLGWLDVV